MIDAPGLPTPLSKFSLTHQPKFAAKTDRLALSVGRHWGGAMSYILLDPYIICAQACLLVLVYDFLRSLRADRQATDSDDADGAYEDHPLNAPKLHN
jgi:hypothetical protein